MLLQLTLVVSNLALVLRHPAGKGNLGVKLGVEDHLLAPALPCAGLCASQCRPPLAMFFSVSITTCLLFARLA